MKYEEKLIKYIFFIIILGLLILSIYIIASDNKKLAAKIEEHSKTETLKKSISIGITGLDSLSPLLTKNKDVQYLLKLVYEPLLDISEDFKIKPKLAQEYSKLDDKTYIIKLKSDIVWHDGEKFTGEDVEFTVHALKNAWKNSLYYNNVKNIEKILLLDEYTLKIFLKEEEPFFEYNLVLPILPKHQYSENYELLFDKPSGTGNYYFENITSQEITLMSSNAKTKKINIIVYDKNANMYSDFTRKNVDVITSSNISYEKYIGTIGYKTITIPDRKFYYILINDNNFFLKDSILRKAINMAINKKEIIYTIYNNKYMEVNFPELNLLKNKSNEFNPNDASKILENETYSLRKDYIYKNGRRITLNLSINIQDDKQLEVAEKIKNNLEDIGISINIIKLSKSNYEYNIENGYYDLILANSILCLEPDYKEYFRFSNMEIDNLLKEIESIDNEKVREEKIETLKKISQEETPFIGLYVSTNTMLINSDLKGDFEANWYNIFYNINTWYVVENNFE